MVSVLPWHNALRLGWERAGRTREAALGREQNLRTPSVAFSTAEKRETGRARDRWAHPPPAGTATSICPQPRKLSCLLIIAAQTAQSLLFLLSFLSPVPPPSLFFCDFIVWPKKKEEKYLHFSVPPRCSDQRFYSAACTVLLLLPSSVCSSEIQY